MSRNCIRCGAPNADSRFEAVRSRKLTRLFKDRCDGKTEIEYVFARTNKCYYLCDKCTLKVEVWIKYGFENEVEAL